MKVDYGFACGPCAEIFVPDMLRTIQKTVRNTDDFTFYVGITAHIDSVSFTKQLKTLFPDLHLVFVINPRPKDTQPSISHGSTLDMIFEKMTGDVGIFSDIDILFTQKHWDTIVDRITDKKVLIGSEYEKNTKHYLNYPNAYFCIFNIKVLKAEGISWLPDPSIVNYRRGTKGIKLDTGYQLYYKLRPKNYDYEIIKLVSNKRVLQYFAHDGITIFIHFKKGRGHVLKKDGAYKNWQQLVKKYT